MEATAIDPRTPCGRRTMPPTMGKRGVAADRRRHRASTPTVQRACRRSVRHDLGSGHRQRQAWDDPASRREHAERLLRERRQGQSHSDQGPRDPLGLGVRARRAQLTAAAAASRLRSVVMPANRMNRDQFYAVMAPNDDARLRKILWTLYWRGNAQL